MGSSHPGHWQGWKHTAPRSTSYQDWRGTTLLGSRDVSQPCCLSLICNLSNNVESSSVCSSCTRWSVYSSRPLEDYITPVRNKRPFRPRTITDYKDRNKRRNTNCGWLWRWVFKVLLKAWGDWMWWTSGNNFWFSIALEDRKRKRASRRV